MVIVIAFVFFFFVLFLFWAGGRIMGFCCALHRFYTCTGVIILRVSGVFCVFCWLVRAAMVLFLSFFVCENCGISYVRVFLFLFPWFVLGTF